METKYNYIQKKEPAVKNLMAGIYDTESRLMDKINKKRSAIREMENELTDLKSKQNKIEDAFNKLVNSDNENWLSAKAEFETVYAYVEGDKKSFIEDAGKIIDDLNIHIEQLEKSLDKAGESTKEKTRKILSDLKIKKTELQIKLDEVKKDSGEKWKDTKHWFIEKSRSIKDYFSGSPGK